MIADPGGQAVHVVEQVDGVDDDDDPGDGQDLRQHRGGARDSKAEEDRDQRGEHLVEDLRRRAEFEPVVDEADQGKRRASADQDLPTQARQRVRDDDERNPEGREHRQPSQERLAAGRDAPTVRARAGDPAVVPAHEPGERRQDERQPKGKENGDEHRSHASTPGNERPRLPNALRVSTISGARLASVT